MWFVNQVQIIIKLASVAVLGLALASCSVQTVSQVVTDTHWKISLPETQPS